MKKNTMLMLIAAFLLLAKPVWGVFLYVDDDGDKDYTTITEALQYANQGDVVYVHKGTYSRDKGEVFPLTVPHGVTILGEDMKESSIDADGFKKPVILLIGRKNIVIKSLAIINARKGIEAFRGADNLTITNCYLSTGKYPAIRIRECTKVTVSNSVLADCKKGIWLKDVEDANILKNTMVGKKVSARVVAVECVATTVQIKYNLIERFGIGIRVDKQDPRTLEIAYNNVHGCAIPYEDHLKGSVEFDGPSDASNTTVDPKFKDLKRGDYRLRKDSPCTGLGAFTSEAEGPVGLFRFKAEKQDDHVLISWLTSSEKENKGWIIYKGFSADGPYVRVNDDLVLGAGSSNAFNSYVYRDYVMPLPELTAFYYLKQVSFDENTTYSPMISLTSDSGTIEALSDVPVELYPTDLP